MLRGMRRAACLADALLLLWGSVFAVSAAPAVRGPVAHEGKKVVALTFDDGPHPKYTAEILDILAEYGVHATFFVIGKNAKEHPDLVLRELAEGHEVGNHTEHHYHTGQIGIGTLRRDMEVCEQTLLEITGVRPTLFRPPEGVDNAAIRQTCEDMGYRMILWCVDTRDWAHNPVGNIVAGVERNTTNGSIILMHDWIAEKSPTPAALRRLIPMLQASGYEFVTVSQLLAG